VVPNPAISRPPTRRLAEGRRRRGSARRSAASRIPGAASIPWAQTVKEDGQGDLVGVGEGKATGEAERLADEAVASTHEDARATSAGIRCKHFADCDLVAAFDTLPSAEVHRQAVTQDQSIALQTQSRLRGCPRRHRRDA
jgi:hypothetical protein